MECFYDSLFEVECEGINALMGVPCLGGYGVNAWSRGWRGEYNMQQTPFVGSFSKRLKWITECASVNQFYLYNFFYWRDKIYKYFIEVYSIWIPEKKGELWTYRTVTLDKHKCYYLGSWPIQWDPINRTTFAPNSSGSPSSYHLGEGPWIPGEYFPQTHKDEIEEAFKTYGPENMHKWTQPDRLTPMQKKAFMEDIEQPDGTWKPSTFSKIEADMSGILVSYKRSGVENYIDQSYSLKKIDAKFEDCKKKEYPGEK